MGYLMSSWVNRVADWLIDSCLRYFCRSGAQLKKVEQREVAPPVDTSNPLLGVNPGINEILAR